MIMHSFFHLLLAGLLLAGCNTEPDNELPANKSDKELEGRVGELEKEVAEQDTAGEHQDQGLRLTHQTVGEVNAYLGKLYANINSTRAQDLPEWQEMYTVLTEKDVLNNPEHGLGPRHLQTNFFRLQSESNVQSGDIKQLNTKLTENSASDVQQNKALDLILERLATIDNNIKDLNKTVQDKFATIDKTLSEYNGRIEGIENRMKTVEIDLDAFRSDFVSFKQRVTNIETLLRRYDLAVMFGDIKNLKDITANHDQRLIDLLGKVQINTSEIAVNRNNLIEAEQELSSVSADVGTLKVAVDEITQRLSSCGCRKIGDSL